MKQLLHKPFLFAIALSLGTMSAWANDTNYAVYNETTSTGYTSLSEAFAAVTADKTENIIFVNQDVEVPSRINMLSKQNITLKAGADNVVIKRGSGNTNMLLLNAKSDATLNIGSADHKLIIDGNNKSVANGLVGVEGGVLNMTNVVLRNATSSTATGGYIFNRKSGAGKTLFTDVTFENCTVSSDAKSAIVRNLKGSSDPLYLAGTITFTNCTGNSFYMEGGVLRNSSSTTSDLTIASPVTVSLDASKYSYNANVLVLLSRDAFANVSLVNDDYGFAYVNKGDIKLREAHTLTVGSYGAATLVLPYKTTAIPEGVKAYTLTYTTGDAATATEVTKNIVANTPVLINAAEGSYKFVSDATTATTVPTEAQTSGALAGVFQETTAPTGSYVLYADDTHRLGFYKAASDTKVKAYGAYLMAESSSAKINIDFGTSTAISTIKQATVADDAYYTLSGHRVAHPAKGIYIHGGKKVIIR